MTTGTIRIFISSPGDVTEERDGARRVIEGLQRLYPGTRLLPVLWEELALPATASFQESIDFLLEREPIDVAVFILWSRLGSPLGASITRPDGSTYRSGTERELDVMLAAFEQSGRERPIILAYARDDDAAFKQRLTALPTSELEEFVSQRKLAEAFIREQFHDAEGRNVRAYQTYREPVSFVQRLRVHLRKAIDDLLGTDAAPSWTDEPYRGLEVFDLSHAAIFHGREDETCELLQRLRDQEQAGCAFVVIVGASGSGKSSLARAGVAANLVQFAGDDESTQWQAVTFIPTLASENLCTGLVRAIAQHLPLWNESDDSIRDIAESLAENAPLTIRLSIAPAFVRATEHARRKVRILFVLDQLEELWTDRHTSSEERERFLCAIEALASSGHVAVLATLRSDFYHHAQASPAFLRLKGVHGHYDLLAPDATSVQRLITEPARLAGLQFERNEQTGRSLDEVIFQDAARDPQALPLLEYTLAELYRQRDESRRMMTYAAYVELGGVEGAIGKRADEAFASLPPEAQSAMDEILPLLVSVDIAGEQAAVRRRASEAELTSTPARMSLVDSLVAARFLTTDRQDDMPIVSLAHEALLRRWDRIVNWINANREQLRLRARVEQTQQRWEEQDRNDSLLLADGLPVDEGRQLLQQAPYLLTGSTSDYIHASIAYHERKAEQSRRRRITTLSTIAGLLVAMIVGGLLMRANNQKTQRVTEASGLVQRLLQANTSELPAILNDLSGYRELTRDQLAAAYADSQETSNTKLHAAFGLLPEDHSLLPFITQRLLQIEPAQVETVCTLLTEHRDTVVAALWPILESPNTDQEAQLLHAASALAMYDAANTDKWNAVAKQVADRIVSENPLRLAVWLNTLRPVRQYLVPPLSEIFRSDPSVRPQSEIDLATNVLEDYADDDVDALSELLLDAEPKQFAALFDEFATLGEPARDKMTEELERQLAADTDRVLRDTLARRQSRAATALLRLERVEPVIDIMHRDLGNPEALTQFVHRCRISGVTPSQLIRCLNEVVLSRQSAQGEARKPLDRSMYGIQLALGEFELAEIPESERQNLTDRMVDIYANDPSSAVHSATGWLLRKWGFDKEVLRVDQTPIPFDESYHRDWYVIRLDITQASSEDTSESSRPIYFTMIVFPPGEYVMGTPPDEPRRMADEQLHQVRLTRPLAVSDRELTWGQWDAFDGNHLREAYSPQFAKAVTDDHPVMAVDWFDAVTYCRWLTERAGLMTEDQCYDDPASLPNDNDGNPAEWPLHLDRGGFRLLTESEWEHVCRSGVRSAYSFGNDRDWLGNYCWFQDNSQEWSHPVAQLRPNPRGLFDIHGNVYEWCHDWFLTEFADDDDPIGADTGSLRVGRGGSWSNAAGYCRSGRRDGYQPADRNINLGFRVALVPLASSSK